MWSSDSLNIRQIKATNVVEQWQVVQMTYRKQHKSRGTDIIFQLLMLMETVWPDSTFCSAAVFPHSFSSQGADHLNGASCVCDLNHCEAHEVGGPIFKNFVSIISTGGFNAYFYIIQKYMFTIKQWDMMGIILWFLREVGCLDPCPTQDNHLWVKHW